MKKISFGSTLIIFAMILFFSNSCKKDDPQPDFPELIGSWSGNTSQDGPVSFYVDNLKGTLFVQSYKIKIFTSSGYQTLEAVNSAGIAPVSGKSFHIALGTGSSGPAFIDGTFNSSDMSLSGNFALYASGNNVDIITGTFLAHK